MEAARPVDGVLEATGDRAVVLRRHEEDPIDVRDRLLEGPRDRRVIRVVVADWRFDEVRARFPGTTLAWRACTRSCCRRPVLRDSHADVPPRVFIFAGKEEASARWRDPEAWARQSILNVARMGRFSSDRAVREHAEHIWRVQPVPVRELPQPS